MLLVFYEKVILSCFCAVYWPNFYPRYIRIYCPLFYLDLKEETVRISIKLKNFAFANQSKYIDNKLFLIALVIIARNV